MRVFFHTRSQGQYNWKNEIREFPQIPAVGEYVALSTDAEDYHLVQFVVHTPFPCDCDVEVYAVAVNHMEAKRKAFDDEPR
jgi:hypothetical protein